MTRTMTPLALCAIALAAPACSDKGEDSGAGTCEASTVSFSDNNNFSYTGALNMSTVTTTEGDPDIEICWDQVFDDIQCHEMDPEADIDAVSLVRFTTLTAAEIEEGLSNNDLQQSATSGYLSVETEAGQTCARLGDFTLLGTEIDITQEYTSEHESFMLTVNTGTTPGLGVRMLMFIEPDPTSTNQRVDVPDGCGVLDFAADLTSLSTVPMCQGGDSWPIEWSGLTTDGLGNEFSLLDIDNLSMGFYAGLTVEELQAQFLDLEQIATDWYTIELTGETETDLALAATADGKPFTGFTSTDGVWALALRCSRCPNPAPLYVTILEPQP